MVLLWKTMLKTPTLDAGKAFNMVARPDTGSDPKQAPTQVSQRYLDDRFYQGI